MAVYFVELRMTPLWQGRTLDEWPTDSHGDYLHRLHLEGRLRMGGPFLDSTGGGYVIDADSDDDASALAAADPGVTEGLFLAVVHPWHLVDWNRFG